MTMTSLRLVNVTEASTDAQRVGHPGDPERPIPTSGDR
jgi:hypothetical protein